MSKQQNTTKQQLAKIDAILDRLDAQADADGAAFAAGEIDLDEMRARSELRQIERDNAHTMRRLLAGGS